MRPQRTIHADVTLAMGSFWSETVKGYSPIRYPKSSQSVVKQESHERDAQKMLPSHE